MQIMTTGEKQGQQCSTLLKISKNIDKKKLQKPSAFKIAIFLGMTYYDKDFWSLIYLSSEEDAEILSTVTS